MKREWYDHCIRLSKRQADFYSGARKIIRGVRLKFKGWDDDGKDAIILSDAGYTKAKLSHLTRGYLQAESRDKAIELWDRRVKQEKYGSVGMSCYNHLLKSNPEKMSKRASVMGPCIQAVTLTWVNPKLISIDAFYRTTELYKKFPADLVFLRDVLLKDFRLPLEMDIELVCHFANVTMHPMYFVTIIPQMERIVVPEMDRIKRADPYFHEWIIKWTARYVCPEYHRGIAKFAQAMRVHKDANERIDPERMLHLRRWIEANPPQFRNEYVPPGDEEE